MPDSNRTPDHDDPRADATDLGEEFLRAAPSAFAFVADEYRMRLAASERLGPGAAHVRFEGPASALDIWHDPRAEIDIYVSRDPDDRLGLSSLLLYVGAPDAERYGGIYSSSEETVDTVLRRLAEGVREYAGPWMRGDAEAYGALRDFVRVESGLTTQGYSREARPGTMQQRLERALRTGEWGTLIQLIEKLPEPLSAAEELALLYARKRLQTP